MALEWELSGWITVQFFWKQKIFTVIVYMEALLFCLFKKKLKAIINLAVGKSFSKIHYKLKFQFCNGTGELWY